MTAAALLLGAGLAGCGTASDASSENSSPSQVLARVGEASIDRGEVDHWARAIGRSNSVATTLGNTSGTPRERALEFLISSKWITGEAEEQGLPVSNRAVERGLEAKIEAVPNGRSEFQEELASTGQTLADVKLEVRSALALARLRAAVARRVPAVPASEVASYYSRHRRDFRLPERRVAYIFEDMRDYPHALALAGRIRPHTRLARPWFREVVSWTPGTGDREKLVNRIFATAPGHVTEPKLFNGRWVLAAVRKLIPAGIQPLFAVRGELLKHLAAQHREQALKHFAAVFVRKWNARTSCSSDYVVQKCSQYRGALVRGNPLTAG